MKTLTSHEVDLLAGLLSQGRAADAEATVRALLRTHPQAGILWKILSVALLRQGKEALEALSRAAELMPADAEAHANLGALLHDRGQWAPALASLKRTLAIQPNNIDALVQAGNALRELSRVPDSLPFYRLALQHDPRLIEAHNNLGNALLQLGQRDDAVASYRRALQIKPDDAQVLANLGNALRQNASLDEAWVVTQRALALAPDLANAHNNGGLILASQGRREASLASFQKALQLDPNYVDALTNAGNVLRDLGARREALAAYARAVELDPRRAECRCNLGNILFELRDLDAAAVSFGRALELQPDFALAHFGLGGVLRLQRRNQEAESACMAALAIDPDYPEALALLGELRSDLGRFTDAEPLFLRAIDIKPDFAFGLASIAANRRMSRADDGWQRRAEALLERRPPLADEINLRFALGKYFDDLHEYERAFAEYRAANELTKRHGQSYTRESLSRRIDGLIQRCDSAFVSESRPYASASQLPVLVVGLPRSGTSLTEQILASHPQVMGAGELTYWDGAFAAYQKGSLAGQSDAALLPALAGSYLQRLQSLGGAAARVVDKMPANFLYAGLIHAALPGARIIHMQRHPIDTCLSIYFQNFPNMGPYANDLDNLAYYYAEYRRLMQHWRTVLPAATFMDVPYEGLIEDQEGWSRRLLEFIGLQWDPRCLDFYRTERVVVTASKWQVRQKLSSASTGRWKNYRAFLGPLEQLADFATKR